MVLRAVFAATVVAGLALVAWRGLERVPLGSVLELSEPAVERIPELLQRIRSFHRVVTRHGEKLLEVSAAEASYFRDDRAVVVREPRLIFFDKGERAGMLSALEGRLYFDGHEVEAVELAGGARLSLDRFSLEAEELAYERSRGVIVASGAAVISSPELSLAGNGLTLDLAARRLGLASGVHMILKHAPSTPALDTDEAIQ